MTDEELSRLLGEDFSSRKKPDPAAEPAPLPQDASEKTVTDIPEAAAEPAIPAERPPPFPGNHSDRARYFLLQFYKTK